MKNFKDFLARLEALEREKLAPVPVPEQKLNWDILPDDELAYLEDAIRACPVGEISDPRAWEIVAKMQPIEVADDAPP